MENKRAQLGVYLTYLKIRLPVYTINYIQWMLSRKQINNSVLKRLKYENKVKHILVHRYFTTLTDCDAIVTVHSLRPLSAESTDISVLVQAFGISSVCLFLFESFCLTITANIVTWNVWYNICKNVPYS